MPESPGFPISIYNRHLRLGDISRMDQQVAALPLG